MGKHCCQQLYDTTFDRKRAESELQRYQRKGIPKTTRPLVEAVRDLPLQDMTLLDIGGGMGSVVFELLDRGMAEATHVELSSAYRRVFLSEVERRELSERVTSWQGDFLDLYDRTEPADLVTLDKVICCYENYEELVGRSVAKTRRWYAYSIPRDVWWVRIGHWLGEQIKRLRKNSFETFLHPPDEIEHLLEQAGFRKIEQRHQREWLIAVFENKFDGSNVPLS